MTPYLVAFALPLGFFGIVGVILLGVYALVNLRNLVRLDRGPLVAALPLAAASVASATISPNPVGSLPPAVGLAILVTVGLQAIRLMLRHADSDRVVNAFLAGTTTLSASVVLDFALQINRLPSGLFLDSSLHNWAAAFMVIASPFALHSAVVYRGRRRVSGAVASIAIIIGIGLSLSWVGAVGLAAATSSYLLLTRRYSALVSLFLTSAAVTTTLLWDPLPGPKLSNIELRGHPFRHLVEVFVGRFGIFQDGVEMSMLRPLLGWGYGNLTTAYDAHPTATYVNDIFAHFHNLFVQYLFETGILGVAGLFLLLTYLLYRQRGPLSVVTIASAIGLLSTQFFDYTMAQSTFVIALWLILGLGENGSYSPDQRALKTFTALFLSIVALAPIFAFTRRSGMQVSAPGLVRLVELDSPRVLSVGSPNELFANLESELASYRLRLHVCTTRCKISGWVDVVEGHTWRGRIATLSLEPGTYLLRLFAIPDEPDVAPFEVISWTVSVE